jgi:hypothetical protein
MHDCWLEVHFVIIRQLLYEDEIEKTSHDATM